MQWLLPPGHKYASNTFDLSCHDGSKSWEDHRSLRGWQHQATLVTSLEVKVTGRFDGLTQKACVAVQKANGLPVTAVLDKDTWDALWATQKPQPAPTPTQTVLEPLRPSQGPLRLSPQIKRRNASAIVARNEGPRPSWYTTPRTSLPRARVILGAKPYSDVSAQLRALQVTHGLDTTGELDAATAWLVDEMARSSVS